MAKKTFGVGPITINGETKSLVAWAKEYDVPHQAVYRRWHQGIRSHKKLFAPPAYKRDSKMPPTAIDVKSMLQSVTVDTVDDSIQLTPTLTSDDGNHPIVGDWIRYQEHGSLFLAIIEYVVDDKIYTTDGVIELDSILEIRRA